MSVAGTYDVVTKTPMGDQKGTFTVNVDGDSFTGNIAGADGLDGHQRTARSTATR